MAAAPGIGKSLSPPNWTGEGGRYGEEIPLGEPSWYQGLNSPYYTPSHAAWREKLRLYVDAELMPIVGEWDQAAVTNDFAKAEAFFRKSYKRSCEVGIVASLAGQPWPSKYTNVPAPANYDAFHEFITVDELFRLSAGAGWHTEGAAIGLPPVLSFGTPNDPSLQERVSQGVLSGEKIICLAVTEPGGGSDVAAVQTTAVTTADGEHYLVNGAKKWITNGIYADYFTAAVRTGGVGNGGLTLLLIERGEGVTTRKMECQGVWPSGTTLVTFEDVLVPKKNIIGIEGQGFIQAMYNFNHERWALSIQIARMARCCLEESLRYARQRKTFGKYLVEHQVIQHKLGEMGRGVEAMQSWLENLTYQLNTMPKEEQNKKLGGHIALLKVQATKLCEFCAREAMQIFGGNGYVRGGFGEKVERIYREIRPISIGGGSEEIMLNLAATQFKFANRKSVDPKDEKIRALEARVAELEKTGAGVALELLQKTSGVRPQATGAKAKL